MVKNFLTIGVIGTIVITLSIFGTISFSIKDNTVGLIAMLILAITGVILLSISFQRGLEDEKD